MAEEHGWKFAQCFGDKGDVDNAVEADIISTVEFDATGNYLASGDKGGRVVMFERNQHKKGCEYKFYTEFQSHEPEFDYLKSLEIEEKINKIKWCRRQNDSHLLLTSNGLYALIVDKTIKLWKVNEKSVKAVVDSGKDILRIPKLVPQENVIVATPKKIFSNAHSYHINSISINSDGETFLSCDDLRVNLWNLGIQDQNIVDIKPANMEELVEVITCAEFHPVQCNVFIYSTSKGVIRLNDMRMAALCDKSSKDNSDAANKTFFTEIIQSISDVKFSSNGRFIIARDYLTLKVWDVNMESKPLITIPIHDHLKPKLSELYENDCIFDKFESSFSNDGR